MASGSNAVVWPVLQVEATERGLYELIEFMASSGAMSRPTFEEFSKRTLRAPIWGKSNARTAGNASKQQPGSKPGKKGKEIPSSKKDKSGALPQKKSDGVGSKPTTKHSKAKPADKVSGFLKLAALVQPQEAKEQGLALPDLKPKNWEEVASLPSEFWVAWKLHWESLTKPPVLQDPIKVKDLGEEERKLLIGEFKAHLQSIAAEAGLTDSEWKSSRAYFPAGIQPRKGVKDTTPQSPKADIVKPQESVEGVKKG